MELVSSVSRSTADSYLADFYVKNHLVADIGRENTIGQTLSARRIKLFVFKSIKGILEEIYGS